MNDPGPAGRKAPFNKGVSSKPGSNNSHLAVAPAARAAARSDPPPPAPSDSYFPDVNATIALAALPACDNRDGPPLSPLSTLPAKFRHELPFAAPSSYLRPLSHSRTMSDKTPTALDRDQMQGLRGLREFLKVRTSYDVLPLSFRLIILDNDLLIRKSLSILMQNSIVSAPLWDSRNSTFAGLLTSTDYINVIQYLCQFPHEMHQIDQFRLSNLRDIERAIGVLPLETVSVHPLRPLYEACRCMLKTRARRIPLVDKDDETGRDTVVSVVTQYRILKFIAVNNEKHTMLLKKTIRDTGLGTYENLATCTMDSSVLDAIQVMVKRNISAVPVLDEDYRVLNVFEAVDVIPLIKGSDYKDLAASVGEALSSRSDDHAGIYTCCEDDRLDSIFDTLRKSRVHRLVVVDDEGRLEGIMSLSDILKYVLLYGEEEDEIRA